MKKSSNNNGFPKWLMAVFGLIALCILTGGHWFYKIQEQELTQKIVDELDAIARLKVDQIVQWRNQRLADAGEIMSSPFFIQGVVEWLENREPKATAKLLDRLQGLNLYHHYKNAFLVDVNGAVLLSLYETTDHLSTEDLKQLNIAVREKKVFLTDLHLCQKDNSPVIEVIAPLYNKQDDLPQPIGALVLQIDPYQFLYPLIQSWPVPSRTGETLIIRREKDEVVFLNKLRHQKHEAFSLKFPLSQKSLPAVEAVLGKTGVFIGTDYRGVQVLSVLLSVPDSSWFMVTKMDADEAFANIRFNKWLVIALTIGLMAAAFAGAGLLWQYTRKIHYKTIYKAQVERQALLSHFEHLVKFANDIIYLVDEKQRIIEANERMLEVYGYSRKEALGLKLSDLVAPEDMEGFKQRRRDLEKEKSILREALHRRKDGSTFPVELSVRSLEVKGQKFTQTIGRDISERKQADAALRSERERFRMLIENSPLAVVMIEKDGAFKYINPRFTEIFGYDLNDTPNGKEWFRKAFPELSLRHHAISSWISDLDKAESGEKRQRTFFVKCKDGSDKFIHFIPIALESGENLMFCDDMTERMEAEEALRESEERYRVAALSTGQLIYDYDILNGRIHWAGAIESITGFSVEEFAEVDIGGWETMIHPEDRKMALDLLQDSINRVKQYSVEYRFKQKSGDYIYIEDIGGFLANAEGKAIRMFGAMKDISARKQAEERLQKLEEQLMQSQKLESIGRLAGGVSHDFNNMLAIIIGYAEIVLKDLPETDPIKGKILEIIKAAERARDLTRQLLAFARKQTLDMTPLDMNNVIKGFERMLKRAMRENVEIKINLLSSEAFFLGDVGQIEQIILNLAINAQDAMPAGGALVLETAAVNLDAAYAESHQGVVPGPYVMLAMSDTGAGMGKDILEKIFEPFFTTKEIGKGTGLGLSTVYGIVKQHGGNITVYSELGRGSTFRLYFPQINSVNEHAGIEETIPEPGLGVETVLVVEDNTQVRDLACEILKMHGYTVIDTPDGQSAIELAKSYEGVIHLLITDVVMPDMNGRELYDHLTKMHQGIKTIFMSGYPADVISHHGVLEAGMEFIQKPFSIQDFMSKVREVLDMK